jgi:hypothetical protein
LYWTVRHDVRSAKVPRESTVQIKSLELEHLLGVGREKKRENCKIFFESEWKYINKGDVRNTRTNHKCILKLGKDTTFYRLNEKLIRKEIQGRNGENNKR